jgi:hypothetical protein
MSRLLHDRFVPLDDNDAWDLGTGARVRLRHAHSRDEDPSDRGAGLCVDWGATPDGGYFEAWDCAHIAPHEPAPGDVERLIEAFDQGADGEPRIVRILAAHDAECASVARMAAREARRRGYVTIAASLYQKVMAAMADELRHRTLALIDTGGAAETVLACAAAFNPRPHVLVSIRGRQSRPRPWAVVREARAVYGAAATDRRVSRAEVAYAAAYVGRHAEAERGLREASAALARRRAWSAAAQVQVMLGRVLMGRDARQPRMSHAPRRSSTPIGPGTTSRVASRECGSLWRA